jgi:hypothetical protein
VAWLTREIEITAIVAETAVQSNASPEELPAMG